MFLLRTRLLRRPSSVLNSRNDVLTRFAKMHYSLEDRDSGRLA